jgi:uncharacterized membrane protein YesL
MIMGRDDRPDFTIEKLPGSRWAVFWDLLRTRTSVLIKINFFTLLFCLPAIAWLYLQNMMKTAMGDWVPFTANLGGGYPLNLNAQSSFNALILSNDMMSFAILIPLLVIACVGFAGAFHSMKMLAWGEGVSVTQTFFKGIKANIVPFTFSGLILGAGIFLIVLNFDTYAVTPEKNFWLVLSIVATIILMVMLVFMALFMFTQAVTYKLKFFSLIRNSFLFAIGMLLQNIFFVGITMVPIILIIFIGAQVGLIVLLLYAFIGISITILVWTLYAQWVFDKFINDKVEGAMKDRGVYRKAKEDLQKKVQTEVERRKSAATRYANPKKKAKKSIEEGKTFTPLATTFSRADLAKLAKEKAEVKKEIDKEFEDEPDDVPADEMLADDTLGDIPEDADFDTSELERLEGGAPDGAESGEGE